MKDPDPYLCLIDPDPGGPKTYGSYGSGSVTLVPSLRKKYFFRVLSAARSYRVTSVGVRVHFSICFDQTYTVNQCKELKENKTFSRATGSGVVQELLLQCLETGFDLTRIVL